MYPGGHGGLPQQQHTSGGSWTQQHQPHQQQHHPPQHTSHPAVYGSNSSSSHAPQHISHQPWASQQQAPPLQLPPQQHPRSGLSTGGAAPHHFSQHLTGAAGSAHSSMPWKGGQPQTAPTEAYHHHQADAGGAEPDSLRSVKDLPAAFQSFFSFRFFNPVQSECFDVACRSDLNMVVSAPTGAGKTGVMELAILRLLSKHLTRPAADAAADAGARSRTQQQQQLPRLNGSHKVIYLGPIKALVSERQLDWQARFGPAGLRVVQLTGDDDTEGREEDVEAADIICSTPEKFDQVTRKVAGKGSMGFFADIGLVLLDEVHLLNESGRGSSLEAGCVCRIKAVAAFPEMSKAAIASVRFVAVSATIPNIADIARWLLVPPAGLRQYGDELRPCKLTTHVKGYAPAKNDFLFERRLNDYLFTIVRDYSKGRPALVFCSSRKGTSDAAAAIVKEAEAHAQVAAYSAAAAGGGGSTGSAFVRDAAQLQRLRAAAASAQAKALASLLVAGVGFHNAAMEPADRALVEELFKAGDLQVLCTTSTLAMGVNLPAHLVVLKGTVRWVGDSEVLPGGQQGYQEYSQTEVLQMVGRAGRPQFDTEGVAVIMTSRDSTSRYQSLLAGQVVESCLLSTLPEHLNAEIVLGTVKDVTQAIAWIKSTFLFTRVRANPQHYGLKLRPGMTEAELDSLLRDQIVLKPVNELMRYQLVQSDEDSFSLTATAAGKLMAANFLRLHTMASIVQLGERPNVPSLLRVICAAEEFKCTSLRRTEKKVLNEINHSKDPEQLRYHVMASKDGNKVKERISLPAEKLFILLGDALADKPSEALDYSLKQEQTRLMVVGQRIAKCMAKYYAARGSFSSAGRSLLLTRSLRARLWEDSKCTVRQLPSVGRQLGARLAAAGLGSLKALAACGDAHRLEVAAQRPYPWGSELLAALKAHTPPAVDVSLQLLGLLPGGRGYSCQLTMTRRAAAAAPGSAGGSSAAAAWQLPGGYGSSGPAAGSGRVVPALAAAAGSSSTFSPCKLLVGCSGTDELLLLRSVVLERFESPLQVQFKVAVPQGVNQPLNVTAMVVHETCVGFDQKASITLPAVGAQQQQQHGRGSAAAAAGGISRLDGPTSSSAAEDSMAAGLEGCEAACERGAEALQQQDGSKEASAAAAAGVRPPGKRAWSLAAAAQAGPEGGGGGREEARQTADSSVGPMQPPAKRPRSQLRQAEPSTLQGTLQPQQPEGAAAAPQPAAGASAAAPLPSSVAARYKSVFRLGAAGLLGPGRQLSAATSSSKGRPGARDSATTGTTQLRSAHVSSSFQAASAAAAASAALDDALHAADAAGELQVTPTATADYTPKPVQPRSGAGDAGTVRSVALAGSSGGQHGWASCGADAQACPVRGVGQAMSSLFDMLADDDDDDDNCLDASSTQGQGQQGWGRVGQQQQQAGLHKARGASESADAAAGTASHQTERKQLEQPQPLRRPLQELKAPAVMPAAGRCVQQPPPDRASASAVFGAAVQQSHRAAAGLVRSMQHNGSGGPFSWQPALSSDTQRPAAQAAASGAAAAAVRVQSQGPGNGSMQTQQQQLVTPPRQVTPVFAGPGLTRPGSTRSFLHSNRAAALAAWAASSTDSGSKSAGPGPRELPDLRRFAFSAGNNNAPPVTQPAGFKPSANAMLFGHLPQASSRDMAQGSLLSQPRAAPRQSASAACHGSTWRTQQQQQPPAGLLPQVRPAGAEAAGSQARVMPWQQFAKETAAGAAGATLLPAGTHVAAAVSQAMQLPASDVCAAQQQSQQQRQAARVAWQGSADASNNPTPVRVLSGSNSLSSQPASLMVSLELEQAVVKGWGGSNCLEQPDQPSRPAAEVESADSLDLGDIFAFMQ